MPGRAAIPTASAPRRAPAQTRHQLGLALLVVLARLFNNATLRCALVSAALIVVTCFVLRQCALSAFSTQRQAISAWVNSILCRVYNCGLAACTEGWSSSGLGACFQCPAGQWATSKCPNTGCKQCAGPFCSLCLNSTACAPGHCASGYAGPTCSGLTAIRLRLSHSHTHTRPQQQPQ